MMSCNTKQLNVGRFSAEYFSVLKSNYVLRNRQVDPDTEK